MTTCTCDAFNSAPCNIRAARGLKRWCVAVAEHAAVRAAQPALPETSYDEAYKHGALKTPSRIGCAEPLIGYRF